MEERARDVSDLAGQPSREDAADRPPWNSWRGSEATSSANSATSLRGAIRGPRRGTAASASTLTMRIPTTSPIWPRQHEWLASRLNEFHGALAGRVRHL